MSTTNSVVQLPARRRVLRRPVSMPGIIITAILIGYASLIVLPFLMPFLFAFKTQLEFAYHPWALPSQFVLRNFVDAWMSIRIDIGLYNTFIVCLGTVLITVTSAALAGYIFARYRNKVTDVLFYVVLAGYFVPVQMVLIPLYRMSAQLGMTNSLVGLFLPLGTFGIPFWSLIYRGFYRGLPEELADAARIDGASHWQVFALVMFPLATPATVLALLLSFLNAWRDYLISFILISRPQLFTMQLRVATFMGQYGVSNMPRFAAAVLISAAPTIILYVLFHKWIIRGTLAGALKG